MQSVSNNEFFPEKGKELHGFFGYPLLDALMSKY